MRKIVVLISFLAITACQIAKQPQIINYNIAWDNDEFLMLDAKELKIKTLYEPSFKSPNIEHLMPYPLEKAIITWAETNLRVSGKSDNTAVFLIKDASVTEEVLNEALIGSKREVYQANVEIALEIIDDNGKKTEALAKSWQQYTSPIIMSLEKREEIWFNMVKEVTLDAGSKLKTTIEQFLSDYIL